MKKLTMNYISFVFAFCLLSGSAMTVSAQNDAAMKSRVRDKAVKLIVDDYDAYANVNNDEASYSFKRLFTSSSASVYNDLLGISNKESLSVEDYADLLANKSIKSKRVSIKNVKVESEPRLVNNRWTAIISFDKEMSYYNDCGVFFSSKEFYGSDYHLSASVVYDETEDRCRIERIDGYVNSDKKLPSEYQVFKKNSERDLDLTYHEQKLQFNRNSQAIMAGEYDSQGFKHPKFKKEDLKPVKDPCNFITMRYGADRKKSFMIKPNVSMDLGKAFSIEGKEMFNDSKSSGFGVGVDFGFPLVATNMFTLSAFAGIGMMSSSISGLSYNGDYFYAAGPEADVDGNLYERHYQGLSYEQSVKLTDLSIPLYLDAEFSFSEMLSAFVDLGLSLNLNMSNSISTEKISVEKIWGLYNQYNNLILDGSWPNNGFTNTHQPLSISGDAEFEGLSGTTASLLAEAGLRFNIPNSKIAIGLGVGMVSGLSNLYQKDNKATNNRIIEYTVDKGEEVICLANLSESVKRQSLRVKIHLIYKF